MLPGMRSSAETQFWTGLYHVVPRGLPYPQSPPRSDSLTIQAELVSIQLSSPTLSHFGRGIGALYDMARNLNSHALQSLLSLLGDRRVCNIKCMGCISQGPIVRIFQHTSRKPNNDRSIVQAIFQRRLHQHRGAAN